MSEPSLSSAASTAPAFRDAVATLRLRPASLLALATLALYVVAALAPHALQTHDPFAIDLDATLQPPSFRHFFGADQAGRDLYSRVVEGASQSLSIGVGATGLALAVALLLGGGAALGGRYADAVISSLVNVLFAFPMLFLALLWVVALGPSVPVLVIAVGLGVTPGYARMIRGQILAVKNAAYAQAAVALGHPYSRIVRRNILPNALRPLIAAATLGVGQSIVWASGLSFLGFGVAPPSPEWGALLSAGRDYVTSAWWLEIMPGAAIALLSLAAQIVSRDIQDRLEGKTHV